MDDNVLRFLGSQNAQAQHQVLQYFEQLKVSDTGWRLCASTLTNSSNESNEQVKFFCFQVIEHYLKTRYLTASPDDQLSIRTFLMTWLQMHCRDASKNLRFICNKAAQMFSLAFIADFPSRWPSFVRDLLNTLSAGEAAIDMYLRILTAIDSEVVDREIAHSPEETERNTALKDALRVESVEMMVNSWYQIITTYQDTNPELVCLCLQVIGAYISWIDIAFIANDRFVRTLLKFMAMPLLRESACDCIHEVLLKGMEPVAKTKLIDSFWGLLDSTGVHAVEEDEEGDFLAKLSKLTNGIGLQLILSWQRLLKAKDLENSKVTFDALEKKLDVMLRLLGNEDDDVSGAVATFAHDYLTVLKQVLPLSDAQKGTVKKLLLIVVRKLKYDESYSWEHEGEDEAMFEEYRKELKVIVNNIGALDCQLLLSSVKELLTDSLGNWQSKSYEDVEVAITLLYQLAEALPTPDQSVKYQVGLTINNNEVTLGQQFSGDPAKVTTMQEMVRLLVTSNVSYYQHAAVTQQFFETIVRYDKFFNTEPQHVATALMAFLDERGLRNPSAHIRSRTSYLFSRFVKDISKHHLQGYLEEILTRVNDLLTLNSPDNGVKHYLSDSDQLFMYETAGILVIQSQFPPEKKQELMKQLLAPVVTKYDTLLQRMVAETDEVRQQAYCECLTQAMSLASRSSKGFSTQQTMRLCGCVEAFTDTLKVFLQALDTPVHRQPLQAGVRQFIHRLVVCLDDEILPFIPVAMEKLLKNPDAKELHDFIPLINQVVCKFKKRIAPFLQEVFMPVVSTIFRVLAAPLDERDQVGQTERKLLQRGYFTFLAALVSNNVTEVLSNQEMPHLQQVLGTVMEGAVELPDPQSQKACFTILKKLVEVWGDPASGLAGFSDFLYENILPACFMAPLKPSFDLNDAQTCLVLNDCANCLKAIQDKRGDEMIQYLQSTYLPSLNVSPETAQEFCAALKSEPKVFKQYFKSFFVRAKS